MVLDQTGSLVRGRLLAWLKLNIIVACVEEFFVVFGEVEVIYPPSLALGVQDKAGNDRISSSLHFVPVTAELG